MAKNLKSPSSGKFMRGRQAPKGAALLREVVAPGTSKKIGRQILESDATMLNNALGNRGIPTARTRVKGVVGKVKKFGKVKEASFGSKLWTQLQKPGAQLSIAAMLMINSLVNKTGEAYSESRQAGLQSDMIASQANTATSESFYTQAALGQAQSEEQSAYGAVLQGLSSGGVLGPSLAQGEYSIGG